MAEGQTDKPGAIFYLKTSPLPKCHLWAEQRAALLRANGAGLI